MADNTTLDPGTGGDTLRDKDRAGVKTPIVGLDLNPAGAEVLGTGDATNGLDVDVTRSALPTGASTSAKQPALGTAGVASTDVVTIQGIASGTVVPVSGTVTASGPLTDTQLRASAVPVDTELPAAGALADATANPTTSVIEAMLACYNGATWDRLRGDITNGLDVDVTRVGGTVTIAGAVTNAGTFATQDSEKITDNAAFTDGTSKVMMAGYAFDEVAGTALTENDAAAARVDSKRAQVHVLEDATTRGQRAAISAAGRLSVDASGVAVPVTDNAGSLTVDAPVGTPVFVRLSDGSAAIATLPVSLAALPALVAGSAQIGTVSLTPGTTGGLLKFHLVSAATTNATNVKASAGQLFGWYVRNLAATDRKVVLHDTAGTPTAGASVFFSINVPAGAAANVFSDVGVTFATGIGITTVTGAADTDATAVSLNDLDINLFYK